HAVHKGRSRSFRSMSSGTRPMIGSMRPAYGETWQSRLASESWLIVGLSSVRRIRMAMESHSPPQLLYALTCQRNANKSTTAERARTSACPEHRLPGFNLRHSSCWRLEWLQIALLKQEPASLYLQLKHLGFQAGSECSSFFAFQSNRDCCLPLGFA